MIAGDLDHNMLAPVTARINPVWEDHRACA
jgi:hypothetical protein